MASALVARALSRTYERARPALAPVDFDIPRGAVLLVLGPSGVGKSTLLNLLGGLDRPTSGSLAVLGREIARLSETALAAYRRTTVTTLFQHHLLPTGLRAEEAVAAPLLWGRGMAPGQAIRRARELLVRFGLSPAEVRRPVQRLSGGQRQRVAFARALAPEPPLLLADEPTSQLDPRNAGLLFTALRDYHDGGGTLVVAAHRPPDGWPFPDAVRLELHAAPAGA